MPVIPPWQSINPLDFIHAAQAGGALGAEKAANAIRAAQVANEASASGGRIGLGYAELNQRAQEAAAATQAQREEAAARLKLAQQQQEAMRMYHEQLQQNRLRDDDRAERALTQRGAFEEAGLGARGEAADALSGYRDDMIRLAEERNRLEQERIDKTGAGSKYGFLLNKLAGTDTGGGGAGGGLPPKDKLVKGQVYDTKFGKATWDGSSFVPLDESGSGPAPSTTQPQYMFDPSLQMPLSSPFAFPGVTNLQ